MTYLLDTNALLFSFANKKELSNKAKEIIETAFDRLIIAQAITMNASIVTRDSQIPKYPVHVEW